MISRYGSVKSVRKSGVVHWWWWGKEWLHLIQNCMFFLTSLGFLCGQTFATCVLRCCWWCDDGNNSPACSFTPGCIKTLPPRQRGYFQHFIPHPKPHPSLHSEEIEEEKASRSLWCKEISGETCITEQKYNPVTRCVLFNAFFFY